MVGLQLAVRGLAEEVWVLGFRVFDEGFNYAFRHFVSGGGISHTTPQTTDRGGHTAQRRQRPQPIA